MIKVNDANGKTKQTPFVILEASDDREGWIYIQKFIEYYMEYHRYDKYEDEDVIDNFDLELRRYRFFRNGVMLDELWIDWTILFHVWDK